MRKQRKLTMARILTIVNHWIYPTSLKLNWALRPPIELRLNRKYRDNCGPFHKRYWSQTCTWCTFMRRAPRLRTLLSLSSGMPRPSSSMVIFISSESRTSACTRMILCDHLWAFSNKYPAFHQGRLIDRDFLFWVEFVNESNIPLSILY